MHKSFKLVFLLLAIMPTALMAQYEGFSAPIYPSPLQISTTYIQTLGIAESMADERHYKEDRTTGYDSETSTASFPERSPEALYKSLAFTPNVQRRRATLTTIAAELEVGNRGRGAELKALLLGDGSGDIIQQMKPLLVQNGLNSDNLADAYTAYWITAWEASRGIFDAPSDLKQIAAVKDLTTRVLGNMPEIANDTNGKKQAFAEVLLVQTLIIQNSAQGVASNPSAMPQFKSALRAQSISLGVDLDSVTLTPQGFVLAN